MDGDKQREALQQMLRTGFAGGGSLTELMDRLGVDGDTWEEWLRESGMPGELVHLSKAMAEMCAPWVWASLLEQTRDGSIPAMKLYFELCREDTPQTAAGVSAGQEILALRQEIFGGGTETGQGDPAAAVPAERVGEGA